MARYSKVGCPNCITNKFMYYQKELSITDRKNSNNNIPIYWCSNCETLIQIRTTKVKNALNAMRVTVFKNKDGIGVYHHTKILKKTLK